MAEKEIARNKKAYHNFSIDEKYEAGMSLLGSEIKSLRKGKVQLKDSYISFRNGEAFIKGMNIARYESSSSYFNHEEERDRRLLLHKDEIIKIASKQKLQGYTCIPLRVYLKNGKAKLEIALAKGKTLYDKREDAKKKTMDRAAQRAIRR